MPELTCIDGITSTWFPFSSLSGIAFCSLGFHPRLRAVGSGSGPTSSQEQMEAEKRMFPSHTPKGQCSCWCVSSLAYSELNPGPDNGDAIDCLRPSGRDTPLKQWVGCHLVHTDRRSGRAWLPTRNLEVTSEREKVLGKQIPNYPVSAPNLTHTAPASQFFDF